MKTETDTETSSPGLAKATIYGIAILAFLLIGYLMVHAMCSYIPATPINAKRAEERVAARKEVDAAAAKELNADDYAVLNAPNGVVRLPIPRAMELTIQGMRDPAGFRSNMNARVENATKPPPAFE